MKRIFVVIIFCGGVFYANGTVDISKSGGKKLKGGHIGYDYTHITEGGGNCTITCTGSGNNECPTCAHKANMYEGVIAIVCDNIDMGLTAGEFVKDGLSCTWSDGTKEEDAGSFIYSYKLRIVEIEGTTTIPVTIQVVPTLVQSNFTIRFSEPVNAMVNVRIIDADGNLHLNSNVQVFGNEYDITTMSALTSGMYYVICTNETAGINAHAVFIKQ